MHEDEQALVEQAKTDPQAFGRLYDRYVTRIYQYAYRRTGDKARAEDVTAATFEKALRHIRDFEWRGQSVVAWLYRIARNEAVVQHRRHKWLAPWRDPGRSSTRAMETNLIQNQRRRLLHEALARLPAGDFEIIQLSYFEELSGDEIAEILNCSRNAAYVRLHRALKRLKEQLTTINSQQITENS